MAASALLEAGLARVLFYPTLLYTVFRGKVPGRAHRDWYHRIDPTVVLGALPLRSMTRRLVQDENVRGVITMNEEYETRFLCNSSKVRGWERGRDKGRGTRQPRPPPWLVLRQRGGGSAL
ncbi:phosphatidylglycerophosphatase and protein-tyrosine phosphatase 1-like [Leptonychotes weddellii]|uniref:Phosphatidylglycerophosphatase and protein-tyrosine phosphatase 1-like n=1 Tax=Leptonychotes weddellii TaxID=9713 RepID=A0A2U3YYQ8_LEPWE|nr:phosphatidylglycerophosphatase and protein-tyrosine phosphatase 1-like [Leptonychotes weddellii]